MTNPGQLGMTGPGILSEASLPKPESTIIYFYTEKQSKTKKTVSTILVTLVQISAGSIKLRI